MTIAAPPMSVRIASSRAAIEMVPFGDGMLVNVSGLIDERFAGFGDIATSTVIIDVSRITRITSFGVRQWLKAMEALPSSITDLYLVRCPPFFVDQLNMVLNFGGSSKVVTVLAPYTCTSCGVETDEVIDVLAERENIAMGTIPEKRCMRCGSQLQFDEIPESYFACVSKYGATSLHPAVSLFLSTRAAVGTTSRPVHEDTGPATTAKPLAVVRVPGADARRGSRSSGSEAAPNRGYVLSTVGVLILAAIVIALVVGAYLVGRAM